MGATQALTSAERAIYDYVSAHRAGASYLMAVAGWTEASSYIISTGQEVMPMGGFSGTVPEPSLAQVRQLVGSGQLRFFLLGGGGGPGQRGGSGSAVAQVARWVQATCSVVPAKDYGGSSAAAGTGGSGSRGAPSGGFGDPDAGSGTLYRCSKAG